MLPWGARVTVLSGLVASSLGAADDGLRVERGLAPHQVVQRAADGAAALACAGTAAGAGRVEGRVLRDGGPLPGLDWRACGAARDGVWSATLQAVPSGGPYRVEWRLVDAAGAVVAATAVEPILVGDLWILAGQSNMQGIGDMLDVEPPSPQVTMYGCGERWEPATEPLHRLLESPYPVYWRGNEAARRLALAGQLPPPAKGAGLGLAFAKAYAARAGVPVGLIPAALGGTSMAQWSPGLRDQGGESLYGALLLRVRAAGGRVAGMLWYQGESDANAEAAPLFADNFARFVAAVRADLGQPELPFIYAQLGRVVATWDVAPYWNAVQEAQRLAEGTIPRAAMATTVDLELDDLIHVGTDGLKRLGRRMERQAARLLGYDADTGPGPRPSRVRRVPGGLVVEFEGVNGDLSPRRHIAGFSIVNASGALEPLVVDASVDRQRPHAVRILTGNDVPDGCALWYGRGLAPYCNLTDSLDLGAPVFGPWPIVE